MTIRHALVTGAGGFLGQVLCRRLAATDVTVTALHRRSRAGPWSREVTCDLARGEVPVEAFEGIDTVFHLAGHAHAGETPGSDDIHRRASVDGTRRLLAACGPGVRRFLFVSSVKAMGECTPPGCLDEGAPPRPQTAYGRARLEAESLVLARGDLHAVVLRLPLVYGAGVKGNLERMLRAIDSRRMPLLPEFGNRRSLVHADDVSVAAVAAVATAACAGRVYLLADGEPYSSRDIQVMMFRALGRPLPRWSVPRWALAAAARTGDALRALGLRDPAFDSGALSRLRGSACYRCDRARADFGFSPRLRLDDALVEMVRAMRAGVEAAG